MPQFDWRDRQDAAMSAADAAEKAAADAKAAALKSAIAWIADVEIVYNTAVSLSLAPRTATFVLAEAKIDDRVYVHRRGKPTLTGVNILSGIMVEGTGLVIPAGTVEVYHVIPAVSLNQVLKIPLRLVAYRSASA